MTKRLSRIYLYDRNKNIKKMPLFQLRREGRVSNVSDVVQRGQSVKVKVLSYTGNKMSLSMKVRAKVFTYMNVLDISLNRMQKISSFSYKLIGFIW